MVEVKDLPQPAQEVLSKVNGKWRTVYQLVDDLGWNQTEVQQWLNSLDAAGWLDSKVVPDGSPAGGSATAYTRRIPKAAT